MEPIPGGQETQPDTRSVKDKTFEALDKFFPENKPGYDVAQRIKEQRNADSDSSLFSILQEEIRQLADEENTDTNITRRLKATRSVIIDSAKKAGIIGPTKKRFSDIQHSQNWKSARRSILNTDMETVEEGLMILPNWDGDFEGILDEYRDVAVLNMDLAYKRASSQEASEEAKRIQRQIKIRGWSTPPDDLEALALSYLEGKVAQEEVANEDLGKEDYEKARGGSEEEARNEELKELFEKLGITEGSERGSVLLPAEIGAVFETSVYRRFVDKTTFPVYDINKPEERSKWLLENMRVFTDGTVSSPDVQWKHIVDDWIAELKRSGSGVINELTIAKEERKLDNAAIEQSRKRLFFGNETEKDEGINGTEKDLKAFVAVAASARAMEMSGGEAVSYLSRIVPGERGPDLGKQDSWKEFLLHKNPQAYKRVIENPFVARYYKKLLNEAGIYDLEEPGVNKKNGFVSNFKVDPGRVNANGNLIKSLRDSANEGGFDEWIRKTLEDEDTSNTAPDWDSSVRWSAAKAACDAFLVDKYSRWVFDLTDEGKEEKSKYGALYPSKNSGGDPLRAILDPSFLPRVIKSMYNTGTQADSAIMTKLNEAFCPKDVVDRKKLVPASMIGDLKSYSRYNDALFAIVGSSRAAGLPSWSKDVLEKTLPQIAELLDTQYGEKNDLAAGVTGKEVVGIMISRILECKALAAATETKKPTWTEQTSYLFGDGPFAETMKFLRGVNLDDRSGWITSLKAERTKIDFNQDEAKKALKNTFEILATNDQTEEGRSRHKRRATTAFVLKSLFDIFSNFGGGKR